jgi:hypothetical protein
MRRAHLRAVERERTRGQALGRRAAATAVGATAVILFPAAADAATFTVTKTADDGTDGTLRKEIQDANAAPGDDVIAFSAVTGTITLNGTDIPITNDSLDIQGPGAGDLTVSGADASRIFDLYGFNGVGEEVSISGLTLTDGRPDGGGGAIKSGVVSGFAASLTVSDSALVGNVAGGQGGAIEANGGVNGGPTVTIADSTVAGNRAIFSGGGVNVEEADLVVERSSVSGNTTAGDGGGLYFAGDDGDSATVTVRRTTISGNTAENRGGGGIAAFRWDEELVIENSTISNNSGRTRGGGIYLYNELDVGATIRNSTIADNSAGNLGGGIYNYRYDNRTSVGSPPVYYDDPPGIDNTTIVSSIVADNTAPIEPDLADQDDPNVDGSFILGFSLVEDGTDVAAFTESTAGSNIFDTDPQLSGLGPAGGPMEVHVPGPTSPVLDAGVANSLTVDQRGLARTVDLAGVPNETGSDGTDMGSVERSATEDTQTSIDSGPGEGSATNDRTPTFGFTSLDGSPTFECSLVAAGNAPAFSACTNPFTQATNLNDGTYTFTVRATSGGNVDDTPATRTFTVDATAPTLAFLAGPDEGMTIDFNDVDFSVEANEPIASFECSLDQGAVNFGACTGATDDTAFFAVSDLADGTYTFRIRATDLAGNVSAVETITFTVDTSDPPQPPPTNPPTNPPPQATASCNGETVVRDDGTEDDDTLTGTGGTDAIFGLGGNDALKGSGGNDCLDGAGGNDALKGGGGKDALKGGPGKDRLSGGPGKDRINCGGGKDTVNADRKDRVAPNCEKVD